MGGDFSGVGHPHPATSIPDLRGVGGRSGAGAGDALAAVEELGTQRQGGGGFFHGLWGDPDLSGIFPGTGSGRSVTGRIEPGAVVLGGALYRGSGDLVLEE